MHDADHASGEDYISEPTQHADGSVEDDYVDLIAEFEEEYGVRVEYSTFGTNENMYNELQINPGAYDFTFPATITFPDDSQGGGKDDK